LWCCSGLAIARMKLPHAVYLCCSVSGETGSWCAVTRPLCSCGNGDRGLQQTSERRLLIVLLEPLISTFNVFLNGICAIYCHPSTLRPVVCVSQFV
jgi:hypothetical protein